MRIAFLFLFGSLLFSDSPRTNVEYQKIQQRLQRGWNTWNTRSVTQYVILPQGFSINIAFKQHYFLEEKYLREILIGRRSDDAEYVRPGPHTLSGSYTSLGLKWEEVDTRISSAHIGDDLVVLISPNSIPKNKVKVILETGMLWNRKGTLHRDKNSLTARAPGKLIKVYTTASIVDDDPYLDINTPYMSVWLDGEIGISTGRPRSLDEIKNAIQKQKDILDKEADKYGTLADAYIAIQAGIAWNLIYEPKHNRVVSTVGRLWNEEYGGYCLFGWDNFFLSYVSALFSKDLAYSNVIDHLDGKTQGGFIPNDNRGNGSKSFDRSQPPVGGIMVKEIYKMYPNDWFLEAAFDHLLEWNRWWQRDRVNEGLLSYGSTPSDNPFNEPVFGTRTAAGYESGMDDSPMYEGVPYNKEKKTFELQDVGLNSLYIADCKALAEMASILGKTNEQKELTDRAERFSSSMNKLWDNKVGIYHNYRTDLDTLSVRISPTIFYPLLADISPEPREIRIVDYFYNSDKFYGKWMLPSTARDDPSFKRQRYWKGAIWPPLNFLTYLSLRKAGHYGASTELSNKSLSLFIEEWFRKGFVSENYSSITGTGDAVNLSSDRFHSWGTLFGIMSFMEKGHFPRPETMLIELNQ